MNTLEGLVKSSKRTSLKDEEQKNFNDTDANSEHNPIFSPTALRGRHRRDHQDIFTHKYIIDLQILKGSNQCKLPLGVTL